MNRFSWREHAPSILVAALSSTFGVALLLVTDMLTVIIQGNAVTARSATVHAILTFIALVFVAIAIFTGAVVTSNTFSTIIAGRTRTIALLRLIGASARSQRLAVAREGFVVGVVGSAIGLAAGMATNALIIAVARATGFIPSLRYDYVDALVLLPVGAVIATTWLASWIGSRRVLVVSPIQATGAAQERSADEAGGHRARNAVSIVLFGVGTGILLLGVALGRVSPTGVLVGVVGGLLSFSGVVLAAPLILPPTLRLVGRALGRGAPARLAARNALRYPERTARTTVGLIIGVTLITMFAVATQTVLALIDAARRVQPEVYQGVDQVLTITAVIFGAIGGFSAIIAAVGMVNNLSLNVLQRRRELGLLRALGFTGRQVRRMIVAESAQLTVAAVAIGLVLGTFYGWAGAESMLGAIQGTTGLIPPAVSPAFVAGILIAAAVLTALSSVTPARRATRVAPVEALAID